MQVPVSGGLVSPAIGPHGAKGRTTSRSTVGVEVTMSDPGTNAHTHARTLGPLRAANRSPRRGTAA